MALSSAQQQNVTANGSSSSAIQPFEQYVEPTRTLLTPIKQLEVLCETMVDLRSLAENGFDLCLAVEFQGWTKFFDRLTGSVYPLLVKEFWIHAKVSPMVVSYFVMGKQIVITENLIIRLIGFEGQGVIGASDGCIDMSRVYAEILTTGQPTNKIKDLKNHYRIWAKIILGYIHHRKPTSFVDYINTDKQYLMFCLGKNVKIDLPHLLFSHLWNHVKDTREEEWSKNIKFKRGWIPLARLISDILTENGLVAYLEDVGKFGELDSMVGKTLDGKSLRKMKIIEKLQSDPAPIDSEVIRTRRIPVDDFPLFSDGEPIEAVLNFRNICKEDGTQVPVDLIKCSKEPAPEVHFRRSKKRKAVGEGTSKTSKVSKKSCNPTLISVVDSVHYTTSEPTPSHPSSDQLSPQNIDDFDFETDTTIPSEHPEPPPEHAQVLSDLDNFDNSIPEHSPIIHQSEQPTITPSEPIHTIFPQDIPVVAPQPPNPNDSVESEHHTDPNSWYDGPWQVPLATHFPVIPSQNIFTISSSPEITPPHSPEHPNNPSSPEHPSIQTSLEHPATQTSPEQQIIPTSQP